MDSKPIGFQKDYSFMLGLGPFLNSSTCAYAHIHF